MTAHLPAVPAKVKDFFDYFLLSADVGQVLAALGYGYQSNALVLPHAENTAEWAEPLTDRLRRALPRLVLSDETATREFLIAPLFLELVIQFDAPHLYGAITVGDVWRFAVLDRQAKTVTQDINLWRVPADLNELVQALVGILNGEAP